MADNNNQISQHERDRAFWQAAYLAALNAIIVKTGASSHDAVGDAVSYANVSLTTAKYMGRV
jgi:hypothetical protein